MSTNGLSRFALDGRVAVVTGAGTGIGRGVALVLAEHGADVVLAARRPEPLEETAREIEALGRRALAVPTDVTGPRASASDWSTRRSPSSGASTSSSTTRAAARRSRSRRGRPRSGTRSCDLNLGSVWFLSRVAAKPMLEQGKGAIVNISSGASLFAIPDGRAVRRRRRRP